MSTQAMKMGRLGVSWRCRVGWTSGMLMVLSCGLPFGHPAVAPLAAQEGATDLAAEAARDSADESRAELIEKLERYLTGAKLKGRYTVLGKDIPPADEEYTIHSAKKLPEGDRWLLEARIQYGRWDQTVPLTVQIKWADKTPVITIERLTIPGMGTFSARVLFNNGMYSGTWAHDDVRGHLFGQVIPQVEADDSDDSD